VGPRAYAAEGRDNHHHILDRLSRSYGRSSAEAAAAQFCALKMLLLQQLSSEASQAAIHIDLRQVYLSSAWPLYTFM
jgi:hypothetical protein